MTKIIALLLLFCAVTAYGQKVKLIEGNANVLKSESTVNVTFEYSPMTIGKDGLSEEEYIKRKKEEYNKKEEGRGDKWEKAWISDRKERFEPKFRELLEEYSKMKVKADARYTIIFRTTRTEPGWNVGVMRQPARIDAEAFLVETANPSVILARYTVTNAPGRDAMGYDFDTGVRLEEAYAKSGKEIGKLIAAKK